jgi:hypothetical protein
MPERDTMNAHTPLRLIAPAVDVDAATIALSKIRNLADALVMSGDRLVQEGDGLNGNIVATLAGLIHDLGVEAEELLSA